MERPGLDAGIVSRTKDAARYAIMPVQTAGDLEGGAEWPEPEYWVMVDRTTREIVAGPGERGDMALELSAREGIG